MSYCMLCILVIGLIFLFDSIKETAEEQIFVLFEYISLAPDSSPPIPQNKEKMVFLHSRAYVHPKLALELFMK